MPEKKKKSKLKSEVKNEGPHWTAFDEKIWGPTKTRNLLIEMMTDVDEGNALSIEHLQVKHLISVSTWNNLLQTYSWFREGIELIKRGIYAKRLDLVVYEDRNAAILKDLHQYSSRHAGFEVTYQKAFKDLDTDQKIKLLQEARKKSDNEDVDFGEVNITIS